MTRYALPNHASPSSVVLYRHERMPGWRGDLLVAMSGDGELLRLRLDPKEAGKVVLAEPVLNGDAGPIRALGVAETGAVYLVNDTSLLLLTPDEGA